jgi:hypothetical protein
MAYAAKMDGLLSSRVNGRFFTVAAPTLDGGLAWEAGATRMVAGCWRSLDEVDQRKR